MTLVQDMLQPVVKMTMEQAVAIHKAAFDKPRDPRSAEYKAGCLACLQRKADGVSRDCPYSPTTPHCDAWYAGYDEGHALARQS